MEIENQSDQTFIFLNKNNENSFSELIKDQRNVRMHIENHSQYKDQFIASVLKEQKQMEQYGLFIDAHSMGSADTKALLKAIANLSRLSELNLKLLNIQDDSQMTEILQICQSLSLTLKKIRFLFYHIEINQKGYEDLGIALSQLQNVNKLCIDVSALNGCTQFTFFISFFFFFLHDSFYILTNIFLQRIVMIILYKSFTKIQEYHQNLGLVRLKCIGEGLSSLINLESLELSVAGTNIGEQGGEILEISLRKTLQQNLNLRKLKIGVHSNSLDNNSIVRIVSSITESAICLTNLHLNFSINNLTNQGLFYIGKHLSVSQSLKSLELDLSKNHFDQEGLFYFFNDLKINSLESLKLIFSSSDFNIRVVEQVRNLLSNNPKLIEIDLQISNSTMDWQSQSHLAHIILDFSFQLKQFNLQGIHLHYWSQVLRPCISSCLHSMTDLANVGLFFYFLCSPQMLYNPNFIFCDLHY